MSSATRKKAPASAPVVSRSTRKTANAVDALTSDLSCLKVADPPRKAVKRPAAARTTTAVPADNVSKTTTSKEAEKIQVGRPSNAKSSSKDPAQLMRTVNTALSALTTTLKQFSHTPSGLGSASAVEKGTSASQSKLQAEKASSAIEELRQIQGTAQDVTVQSRLTVDKAAVSLCGLLIELKMVNSLLRAHPGDFLTLAERSTISL